jgi:hypothetical protein
MITKRIYNYARKKMILISMILMIHQITSMILIMSLVVIPMSQVWLDKKEKRSIIQRVKLRKKQSFKISRKLTIIIAALILVNQLQV